MPESDNYQTEIEEYIKEYQLGSVQNIECTQCGYLGRMPIVKIFKRNTFISWLIFIILITLGFLFGGNIGGFLVGIILIIIGNTEKKHIICPKCKTLLEIK